MFYVIDRNTGEQVYANGFFAITEDGQLIDVIDGWGCEGGGGSSDTPESFIAVMGKPPKSVEALSDVKKEECVFCGKKFKTVEGLHSHWKDTRCKWAI